MSLIDLRPRKGNASGSTDMNLVESGYRVEEYVLSAADITNGYKDLARTPTTTNKTKLAVINGLGEYDYGIDYNVIGNRLTWLAPLIPILEAGDTIKVTYFTATP